MPSDTAAARRVRLVTTLSVLSAVMIVAGGVLMAQTHRASGHVSRLEVALGAAGLALGVVTVLVFAFTRPRRSNRRRSAGHRRRGARSHQAARERVGGSAPPRGAGQAGRDGGPRARRGNVLDPTTVYSPGGLLDIPRDARAPGSAASARPPGFDGATAAPGARGPQGPRAAPFGPPTAGRSPGTGRNEGWTPGPPGPPPRAGYQPAAHPPPGPVPGMGPGSGPVPGMGAGWGSPGPGSRPQQPTSPQPQPNPHPPSAGRMPSREAPPRRGAPPFRDGPQRREAPPFRDGPPFRPGAAPPGRPAPPRPQGAPGGRGPAAPGPAGPRGAFDGGYAQVIRATDYPGPGAGRGRPANPARPARPADAEVFVYRDEATPPSRPTDSALPRPSADDAAYWYDLVAEDPGPGHEEARGPFEPLLSSSAGPSGGPGEGQGRTPAPPEVPGQGSQEAPEQTRARKLEQLKDLYLTAEAIGEQNVDKHFDRLLAQQRELISEYFRQAGPADPSVPSSGPADPEQTGASDGQATPPEDMSARAEPPRAW